MSINRVVLSGNLTRDAELRYTAAGDPVLEFGIAVNDRRKNKQTGEWEDVPSFVECVMFGTRAEKLAARMVKGIKVSLDGRLRWSSWEKDGARKSKLEVIVNEIDFMSSKGREEEGQSGEQIIRDIGGAPVEYFEEDVPF